MGGAHLDPLFAAFMGHHMGDFGAGFSERGIDRAASLFGPNGMILYHRQARITGLPRRRRHSQGFMGAAVECTVSHCLFQNAFDRAVHVAGQRQHIATCNTPSTTVPFSGNAIF